jgi:hypothetical protein
MVPDGTLCAARKNLSKAARCRENRRVKELSRPRSGQSKQLGSRLDLMGRGGTASKICTKRMGEVRAFSTAGTQALHRRTVSALARLRRLPLPALRCLTAVQPRSHPSERPGAPLDPSRGVPWKRSARLSPPLLPIVRRRRLSEPQRTAGPPARK